MAGHVLWHILGVRHGMLYLRTPVWEIGMVLTYDDTVLVDQLALLAR